MNRKKRRLWRVALAIFAAHTMLFITILPQVYFHNVSTPTGWLPAVTALAVHIYAGVFIAPLVLWIGYRLPVTRENLWRNLFLHLAFGIISGCLNQLLQGFFFWAFRISTAENAWLYLFKPTNFFNSLSNSLIQYAVIIAIQQAFLHFRESQKRAFLLQQAELEVLKMQLHPHFFFNTLNAISALMYRSPKDADRMITQLGDLFRFALKKDKAQEVSLNEELKFLQAFLQIHQTLMGKRLRIEWKIEPETLDALVPNLILQPLAENAIQHGLAPLEEGGKIEISAARLNGNLVLRVKDDGHGAIEKTGNGIGLSNTRARLKNLYGAEQNFEINSPVNGGFTAEVRIPFREQPAK